MRIDRLILCSLLCLVLSVPYVYSTLGYKHSYTSVSDKFTFLASGSHRSDRLVEIGKYIVSIRTRAPKRYFGDNHFCAGTIIGPRKIITAAHCTMDKRKVMTRPRRLLIVAGSFHRLEITATTKQFPVKATVAHPSYIRNNTNDIAIIFLYEDLPIDNNSIIIAPLTDKSPDYDMTCDVLGWGRLYAKGPLAALLTATEVKLFQPDECRKSVPTMYYDGLICAMGMHSGEDPCRGDSGGPLICELKLYGVISWSVGCGNRKYPSLFADVYHNLQWINSVKDEAHYKTFSHPHLAFVLLISFANY